MDRFCGTCGTRLPADEETAGFDLFGDAQDPLAEWEEHRVSRPPVPPAGAEPAARQVDEAPTESIPRPGRVHDTAVLPESSPAPSAEPPRAPVAPPAQAPAAPPPAPPRKRFPLGATLSLLGAMAVVFSALLEWAPGAEGAAAAFPREIAFRSLLDVDAVRPGLSLGLVLLIVGVAGALISLLTMVLPILKFLRRIAGLIALAVVGLFAFRALPSLADAGRVTEFLGSGVYVAAAGALVQMVAGRWFRR